MLIRGNDIFHKKISKKEWADFKTWMGFLFYIFYGFASFFIYLKFLNIAQENDTIIFEFEMPGTIDDLEEIVFSSIILQLLRIIIDETAIKICAKSIWLNHLFNTTG